MTNEEYEQERQLHKKMDRIGKRVINIVILLFVLTPFIIHIREGDLQIHLDYNAKIYATKYTWWGFGPDKMYSLKEIKGEWYIRERGFPDWEPIYFDIGIGGFIPEQSFP